jgi:excinuclease ABC subunit C
MKGNILYIGKAKNLSKRVINYTNLNNLTRRLQRMVSLTKKMNFFVTNTEIEALLLECNLIKRHKPRFNIILRDDKSFPYILINKEHKYPRLQKYRGTKKIKGDYFGPFVSPSVADYTLIALQKAFLLRSCSEGTFSNRSRPCLLYDIKRCSGPCVEYINEDKYRESIDDAKKFLKGNTKKIEKKLTSKMKIASKNQMFEEAGRLRDRIKSVNQIQKYQSVYIKEMRTLIFLLLKLLITKAVSMVNFIEMEATMETNLFFLLTRILVKIEKYLSHFFINFMQTKIYLQKY